jgi:hypothetical protein
MRVAETARYLNLPIAAHTSPLSGTSTGAASYCL